MEELVVRCYSGHTYAQEPRSFVWRRVKYEVEEIVKTWREPGERYFLVETGGNKSFQLCYNDVKGRWSLKEVVRR